MTKHTIVFLAVSPSGTDPHAVEREARAIHLELRRSGYRDRFKFETRWVPEPLDPLRELRELKPTVVHFSGRGGPDGLCFQDAAGRTRVVSPAALAEAFGAAGASVKLVVLSACYSEALANALLEHIDHVVGIGGSVHEDAARIFAIGFYGGLGEHETIEIAYRQGQAAIKLEGLPDGARPHHRVRPDADAAQLILPPIATEALAEIPPCPYPGMWPYSADSAAHFHGRDAEVKALLERLRVGERELYVIGPSGSGKSSLVEAGLLPRLARGVSGLGPFVVRSMRPGEQPTGRLLETLKAPEAAHAAPEALEAPERAAAAVMALLEHWALNTCLLLVIDQLEELFTLADADAGARFLEALRALRAEPRCVLVLVLRADFYGTLMNSRLWSERPGQLLRVDVAPLRGEALRDAIVRPARDLGVRIEDALVERLLTDAAWEPGILPLLQETLIQLWEQQQQRRLALANYEALGEGGRSGLAVAISDRADASLCGLTDPRQTIARRILLRLVSFGEGRADTRRQQPRSALRSAAKAAAEADKVIDHLVVHRLLTVDDDDRVDLAHEVMISAWPTLVGWIQTRRADEQRRRQFEAAAAQWVARGRGARGLFDPIDLAEAKAWQATESARELGQSADLVELIAASRAAQDRRRMLRRVAFATLAAITVVVAGLAHTAHREARDAEASRNRAEADRRRAEASDRESQRLLARSYLEAGWQQLLGGHPQEALPYLLAARERGEDGELLRLLIGAVTRFLPVVPILEHRAAVSTAAFSLDGTRVVTASSDHTARIWDAATGKPRAVPLEHRAPVSSAAFSLDGTRVVTTSEDHTARIWDAVTGRLHAALEHRGAVWRAAFSPDGTRVVTASEDHTARIWDTATGKPLATLAHEDVVWSVAFSPDGTRVVTASFDTTARVWDAATGKPLAVPLRHQGRVNGATFSHDGTRVVTSSFDRTARIWDAATGEPLGAPLRHESIVRSAAFSPDGARVVTSSSDHTARIWDVSTSRSLATLAHPSSVRSAAFSPDGTRLVTASFDHYARVWDAATGELLCSPLEHQGGVNVAAFRSDGARVVTASLDSTARVWNAGAGKPVASPLAQPAGTHRTAYSPDGARAVIANDDDNTARIWDVATGKPVMPPLAHQGWVWSAAFSPDGSRVVTASLDSTARVWDAITGKPLTSALEHRAWVWSAAFSPDGSRVVTASLDSTARVWDAATGELLATVEHQGSVNTAAFSPGGACIVTASDDRTARIWDAATGKPVGPPLQHPAAVSSAVFSPDGTRITTASGDQTARVWETRLDETAPSGWLTLAARSPFVLGGAVHVRRPPGPALWIAPRITPAATAGPGSASGFSRSPASPDEAIATPVQNPSARLAAPIPFAPGQIWSGHYYCAQGKTSLGLQITSVRDNLVEAMFEFSHAESGASGSHHVSGRYDPTSRRLDLQPEAWVRRPPGFVMVGMSGTVSADGWTFVGSAPGCTCGVARSSAAESMPASAIPDGACSTFKTRRR